MNGPTSRHDLARPMGVALAYGLHVLLVSSCALAVCMHGERCRVYLIRTLGIRALCNGRTDLQRPSGIYGGPKRLISEVLMIFNNYLPGGFEMLPSRSQAVNTFDHHDRSGVKGLSE